MAERRKPYQRPKPPPRPLRASAQPELDQRCVACRAGSHKNCRTRDCTCNDDLHRETRDA